ncbi:MAG: hypothetical protein U1A77_18165 [Pirellulales bacterium]
MLRIICGVVMLAWFPASVSAQATLQRRFVDGATSSKSVDVLVKQTMSIQGMNLESSSQQNSVVRSTNGKRSATGELRIASKVETLQANVKAPGLGEVMFDSVNPDKATDSLLTPVFKAAAQATWTTVLDRDNRVIAVEGKEKAFEVLDEQLSGFVKGQNDPDYLKFSAQLEQDRIPSKPLKVGDSWQQDEPLRLDGSQTLTFSKKYTYRGIVEVEGRKLHHIDVVAVSVKLSFEANGPIMLKLIKSDLKVGQSTGKLLFDGQLGDIVSDVQSHQIKGSLTLGIAGQEVAAELDLTMETSTVSRR